MSTTGVMPDAAVSAALERLLPAALVGIELSSAGDLPGLLERMKTSECHIEMLEPGTPAYRYLT